MYLVVSKNVTRGTKSETKPLGSQWFGVGDAVLDSAFKISIFIVRQRRAMLHVISKENVLKALQRRIS